VGRDAYVLKSQVTQERDELCLRQSTGDSTSPQIDVATNVFAEFGIEHYISKL